MLPNFIQNKLFQVKIMILIFVAFILKTDLIAIDKIIIPNPSNIKIFYDLFSDNLSNHRTVLFLSNHLDLMQPPRNQILDSSFDMVATIFYGPVEIWHNELPDIRQPNLIIERKITNENWETLGTMNPALTNSEPKIYHFEDVSNFPRSSWLCYRLQSETHSKAGNRQMITIPYLPNPDSSQFIIADYDKKENKLNVAFHLAISGHLKIDIFDAECQNRKCVFKRILNAGTYSFLINLNLVENVDSFSAGFCRFDVSSLDGKKSFIQLKEFNQK